MNKCKIISFIILIIILLTLFLSPLTKYNIIILGLLGLISFFIFNTIIINDRNTNLNKTKYIHVTGSKENTNKNLTIANFNVMSDQASKYILAGDCETPNQYNSRYKLIIDQLNKLVKSETDLIMLEEVTDNFMKNYIQKWLINNNYKYIPIYRCIPLKDKNNNAIKKEQTLPDGTNIKIPINLIQNVILVTDRFQIVYKNKLSKKLDDILYDLKQHSKVQVIPLYDNITKTYIAVSNIHLTGDKSPKGESQRTQVIKLINEFIDKTLPTYNKIIIGDFNSNIISDDLNNYLIKHKLKLYQPNNNTSYSRFEYNRITHIYSVKSNDIAWEKTDKLITNMKVNNIKTIPNNGLDGIEVPYKFIGNEKNLTVEKNYYIWPSDHTINIYKIN